MHIDHWKVEINTATYGGKKRWASECPDVKNYKWQLNPVWHRILYSCTHIATVGVKGLRPIDWSRRLPTKKTRSIDNIWQTSQTITFTEFRLNIFCSCASVHHGKLDRTLSVQWLRVIEVDSSIQHKTTCQHQSLTTSIKLSLVQLVSSSLKSQRNVM